MYVCIYTIGPYPNIPCAQQCAVHPHHGTPSSPAPHTAPTPDAPEYDEDTVTQQFDILQLNVYHKRGATGFEESKELSLPVGSLVAGRYQVLDYLGSAAFSNAVQAADLKEGGLVCLKIVKVREAVVGVCFWCFLWCFLFFGWVGGGGEGGGNGSVRDMLLRITHAISHSISYK